MSTWQFDASAANDFVITGVLACLDGYMNIALEQTEEYVNGQLKNKYGDAFIRGNNGKYILVVSCMCLLPCCCMYEQSNKLNNFCHYHAISTNVAGP